MKIVADTNVLVSALIQPKGIPAQIMAHQAAFALVATEEILSELQRVLHYRRIQKKYRLSNESIAGVCGEPPPRLHHPRDGHICGRRLRRSGR